MTDDPAKRRQDTDGLDDDLGTIIAKVAEHADASGYFERVEEQLAEQQKREAAAKRERELAALDVRGVPRRYADRIVDGGLLPTKALATARKFLDGDRKWLLVLSGPAGCGKTLAASWLVANAPSSSRFIHASHLQRVSPYSTADMAPLETAALLAVDDAGVEYSDKKRMMLSILDALLEVRGGNLRKTVLTTNLPFKEFAARYEGRIVDRVRDGAFVEFNNHSLRGLH